MQRLEQPGSRIGVEIMAPGGIQDHVQGHRTIDILNKNEGGKVDRCRASCEAKP